MRPLNFATHLYGTATSKKKSELGNAGARESNSRTQVNTQCRTKRLVFFKKTPEHQRHGHDRLKMWHSVLNSLRALFGSAVLHKEEMATIIQNIGSPLCEHSRRFQTFQHLRFRDVWRSRDDYVILNLRKSFLLSHNRGAELCSKIFALRQPSRVILEKIIITLLQDV